MPFYEDEKCPVCNRKFSGDDDIVTCPVCGTPHHRECYNSLGGCVNTEKHSADFEYQFSTDQSEKAKEKYYTPKDSAEENKSEQENIINFTVRKSEYENSKEEIDGKPVSDVAAVVGINEKRFIPKFIENKKASWNWAAFFFGPYYLLFRKMYKQGALFIAVNLIVNLVVQGVFAKPYSAYLTFVNSNAEAFANAMKAGKIPGELMNEFMPLAQNVLPMMLIISCTSLVIAVVCALFADRFYKKRVIEILSKVDSKLNEGGQFSQASLLEADTNIPQETLRKIYLGKMGGITLFAPVLAYFVLDLITILISKL